MGKPPEAGIDALIDKLTSSILNTISGDSFKTEVALVNSNELRKVTMKKGWKFNWRKEFNYTDREVHKLTIVESNQVIQGLASISDFGDHFYLHLVESAPFNFGRFKLYEGVPGNLFAYACKRSWDAGYQGFVAFQSKTSLINHYEAALGAVHVGNHKLVIFPHEALRLIKRYFPEETKG